MKSPTVRLVLIAAGAVLAVAVLALVFIRPAKPPARPSAAVPKVAATRGEQVFDQWCASCHGRGPGHPGTQSLEVKYGDSMPAALQDRTDLSPEVTTHFVRHGFALMPFYRKTEISDADLKELADYLAKKK